MSKILNQAKSVVPFEAKENKLNFDEKVEKKLKEILFDEPHFDEFIKRWKRRARPIIWNSEEQNDYIKYFKTRSPKAKCNALLRCRQNVKELQVHQLGNFLKSLSGTQKTHSDFQILIENEVFKTHRIILSCFIPSIFEQLFEHSFDTKQQPNVIRLHGISLTSFKIILDYVYTGKLAPNSENFIPVLETAMKLQMVDFPLYWVEAFEEIFPSGIGLLVFKNRMAGKYGWTEYINPLNEMIAAEFETLVCSHLFMELTFKELKSLLEMEEVGVQNEIILFLGVLKWLSNDWNKRKKYSFKLMSLIRFMYMKEKELFACLHPPIFKSAIEVPEVKALILDTIRYQMQKNLNLIDEKTEKPQKLKKRKYIRVCGPALKLWTADSNITQDYVAPHVHNDQLVTIDEVEDTKFIKLEDEFLDIETGVEFTDSTVDLSNQLSKDDLIGSAGDELKLFAENALIKGQTENIIKPSPDAINKEKTVEADDNTSIRATEGSVSNQPANNVLTKKPTEAFTIQEVNQDTKIKDDNKIEDISSAASLETSQKIDTQNADNVKNKYMIEVDILESGPPKKEPEKKYYSPPSEAEIALKNQKISYQETSNFDVKPPCLEDHGLDMSGKHSHLFTIKTKDAKDSSALKSSEKSEPKSLPKKRIPLTTVTTKSQVKGEKNKLIVDIKKSNQISPTISLKPSSLVLFSNKFDEKQDVSVYVTQFNPSSSNMFKWKLFTKLPVQSPFPFETVIVGYLNSLFIVGGIRKLRGEKNQIQYAATNECFRFEGLNKKLVRISEMSFPRVLHSVCVFNNKVFVAGGLSKPYDIQNEISIFDPTSRSWQESADRDKEKRRHKKDIKEAEKVSTCLVIPVYAAAITGFRGRVWLLGGLTTGQGKRGSKIVTMLNEVQVFDFKQNQWFKLKYKLPIPLSFASAVDHNGKIVIAGGKTVSKTKKKATLNEKVFVFDYDNKTWTEGPSFKKARCNICLISYGPKILAFGGSDKEGTQSRACYTWTTNKKNQDWIYEPNALPVPTAGQVIVLVPNNDYWTT